MSKNNEEFIMTNDATCANHDVLVKSLSRFEQKLDKINDSSSEFNTKLAEFLARHDEQEKRFYSLENRVIAETTLNVDNKTAITILIENQKSIRKDIDNLANEERELRKQIDTNRMLMYTGTIAGLSSLLLFLGNMLYRYIGK